MFIVCKKLILRKKHIGGPYKGKRIRQERINCWETKRGNRNIDGEVMIY